jgi:ferredoxin
VRVVVDELRCDAHGVCVDACPEVFALDDDEDMVTVLQDEPDESLRASLERAALMCPKAAITIEGPPDGH